MIKVVVAGATGLVGSAMIRILEERGFPAADIIPVASDRSRGKEVVYKGIRIPVTGFSEALASRAELALFSAGGDASLEWAPRFAASGTTVIDNSSAWRMHPDIKLVVPEINAMVLTRDDAIIANPNCSTIQMVMALHRLHARYRIRRIVVSTYQSVSGSGRKALNQLANERNGIDGEAAYAHPIDLNVLPQVDVFLETGYTREELKMVNETRKILQDDTIQVTATAVRVPVTGGHSESINVEFEKNFDMEEVRTLLLESPGLVYYEKSGNPPYPMPRLAEGRDEVFVGRLRRDESHPRALNLWVVSDNLRKGAATNAIQIAEYLLGQGFLNKETKHPRP